MSTESVNFKTIIVIMGAFISYTVGAGFASGNEVLQFFGSWGFPDVVPGIIGAIAVTIIFCNALFRESHYVKFEKTTDAYVYFGGKGFGTFFKYYVFVLIFGCFMLMFSGAGSLLNQAWNLPQWVGSVLMGIVAGIVVLGGLKTIENVLGSAGVIILIYTVVICIVSLFNPGSSFEQSAMLSSAVEEGKVLQTNLLALPPFSLIPGLAKFNSSLLSGVLYGTLNLVSGFPFYLTLGYKTQSKKEATLASIVTAVGFYLCVSLIIVILLFNFNSVINPATGEMFAFPVLSVVESLWPSGSWTYVLIIFIAIFTTVSGYLWALNDWFFHGKEDDKQSKIFIICLLVFAITLGGVIPFSKLINALFPISGFVGLIMTIILLVKSIKGRKEPNQKPVEQVSK